MQATGCSTCSSEEEGSSPSVASAAASGPFAPGDRVVAEYARAAFVEGTVAIVGPDGLTITEKTGGATRKVDAANVYRLDGPTKQDWDEGDLAICRMSAQRWLACRVEASVGDKIAAVDEKGEDATLSPEEVIEPTPVTKLNIEHVFDRVKKAKAFAAAAREAGAPYRPADWKPRKAEGVIVRNGGAYVSATVHEWRKALALVRIAGSDDKPRAVAHEDVWPQPPVDASPTVGGFACLRPSAGEHVWRVVRVNENRDAKVVVGTPNGDKRVVESHDILPFAAPKPSADQ